ncbi:apoptosis-associated speck-like protein containing a CARD [Sphaerodactylus townsendi]|uniref:apoptosis-associated speck-like protein containing a CARD n=1 Tax=Sphaerodactylus townsendi TaxID=933632 RepID=UPI00202675BA|nr:apoptosis-associated speck-like protein containing a CARD [Sphaerodactylus townsendi]
MHRPQSAILQSGLEQALSQALVQLQHDRNESVQTPERSFQGASRGHGPQEAISMGSHFIDRHRAELIQRTSTVEAVLDLLLGRILNDEQYERIASRETNADKMRELYRLVPSWDNSCKDQLYEALKAKNRFLIRDLEGR